MILPDYKGRNIVNLISSILMKHNIPNLYPELNNIQLPEHKKLVFIVVDALGYNFLCNHATNTHIFEECKHHLTSVFPSTTTSALTSLMTGVAPLQHAMTGWFMYFSELATASIALPFLPRYNQKPFKQNEVNINDILNFETIFKRIKSKIRVISPKITINSQFSKYCFGRKNNKPFENIDECFQNITKEVLKNDQNEMIFAYIPDFDECSHIYGIRSKQSIELAQKIDKLFSRMIKDTKNTDTLYILTADHGQIESEPEKQLNINDFKSIKECLILPLCGVPRAPFCYVKNSKYKQFVNEVNDKLGFYAEMITQQEAIEKNLFGYGEINPKFYDRVGDAILLMKDNYVMFDYVYKEQNENLIGHHGGLTEDEMKVPLVLIK
jgi:predicted AlkP superfamily pyrophosphatase or phosphodiesterase